MIRPATARSGRPTPARRRGRPDRAGERRAPVARAPGRDSRCRCWSPFREGDSRGRRGPASQASLRDFRWTMFLRVGDLQKFRLRAPASGREAIAEVEPEAVYVDRESGEDMLPVTMTL